MLFDEMFGEKGDKCRRFYENYYCVIFKHTNNHYGTSIHEPSKEEEAIDEARELTRSEHCDYSEASVWLIGKDGQLEHKICQYWRQK